jgi:hypothetical protein
MIRLIQWLIFGHLHRWQRLERVAVYDEDGPKLPVYIDWVCSCERCGAIRKFRT